MVSVELMWESETAQGTPSNHRRNPRGSMEPWLRNHALYCIIIKTWPWQKINKYEKQTKRSRITTSKPTSFFTSKKLCQKKKSPWGVNIPKRGYFGVFVLSWHFYLICFIFKSGTFLFKIVGLFLYIKKKIKQ